MKSALRIALLVVLALIVAMPSVFAAEEAKINVQLDGDYLDLSTDPVIQNGRTLVPFRSIFEAMGMTVDWDPNSNTVTGKDASTEIKLTIGSDKATVNGESKALDAAVINTNGHTMIPLRFVSEAVGNYVEWKNTAKEVHIWGIDPEAVETFKKIVETDLDWNAIAVNLSGEYSNGKILSGELRTALSGADPQMQLNWRESQDIIITSPGSEPTYQNNTSTLNLYFKDNSLRRNTSLEDQKAAFPLEDATSKSKLVDINKLDISEDALRGAVLNRDANSKVTSVTLVLDAKAAYEAFDLSIFGAGNLFANSSYEEVVIEIFVDGNLRLENIKFSFDYESAGIAELILNLEVTATGSGVTLTLPEVEEYNDVSLETIMKPELASE